MSGLVTPTLGGIDVLRLPCMPLVLRAALERAGEGRNMQALADAVAQDPALAARFLATSLAGSPSASATHASLARHVDVLGTNAAQAVLMRSATDRLRRLTPSPVVPDGLAFWVHSLHCAHLPRRSPKRQPTHNPKRPILPGCSTTWA